MFQSRVLHLAIMVALLFCHGISYLLFSEFFLVGPRDLSAIELYYFFSQAGSKVQCAVLFALSGLLYGVFFAFCIAANKGSFSHSVFLSQRVFSFYLSNSVIAYALLSFVWIAQLYSGELGVNRILLLRDLSIITVALPIVLALIAALPVGVMTFFGRDDKSREYKLVAGLFTLYAVLVLPLGLLSLLGVVDAADFGVPNALLPFLVWFLFYLGVLIDAASGKFVLWLGR